MQKWNFDCEQRSSFRWFYLRVLKCPSLWHACCMNKNYKFQFYTFKLMSKLTWQSWIPLHNLEGIIKLPLTLVPFFCRGVSKTQTSDPEGLSFWGLSFRDTLFPYLNEHMLLSARPLTIALLSWQSFLSVLTVNKANSGLEEA